MYELTNKYYEANKCHLVADNKTQEGYVFNKLMADYGVTHCIDGDIVSFFIGICSGKSRSYVIISFEKGVMTNVVVDSNRKDTILIDTASLLYDSMTRFMMDMVEKGFITKNEQLLIK